MEDEEDESPISGSAVSVKLECQSFEDLLQLVPGTRLGFGSRLLFYKRDRKQAGDPLTELETRRRLFREIYDFIPADQSPEELPEIRWFDSNKPLMTLCTASIEFMNRLSAATQSLLSIKEAAFSLVEQEPRSGDITFLSGLLILLVELLPQVPWADLCKSIHKHVTADIDTLLIKSKKFKIRVEKIEKICGELSRKAGSTFKRGPTYEPALPPHPSLRTQQMAEDGEVKIGLSQERDLLIAAVEVQFRDLQPSVQLGFIYMLMQLVLQDLQNVSSLAKRAHRGLNGKFGIKKWTGMGVGLTVFEAGLFTKARWMVQGRMNEVNELAMLLALQTKFLFTARDLLKKIKLNLEKGPYPPFPNYFRAFQIGLASDKRFENYIASGDWENLETAGLVAQEYIIK